MENAYFFIEKNIDGEWRYVTISYKEETETGCTYEDIVSACSVEDIPTEIPQVEITKDKLSTGVRLWLMGNKSPLVEEACPNIRYKVINYADLKLFMTFTNDIGRVFFAIVKRLENFMFLFKEEEPAIKSDYRIVYVYSDEEKEEE